MTRSVEKRRLSWYFSRRSFQRDMQYSCALEKTSRSNFVSTHYCSHDDEVNAWHWHAVGLKLSTFAWVRRGLLRAEVFVCSTLMFPSEHSFSAASAFLSNKNTHSVTLGIMPMEIMMSNIWTSHKYENTEMCFKLFKYKTVPLLHVFSVKKFKGRPERKIQYIPVNMN